jgi:uncharacterized protein (TIGR00645 family)
VPVAPAPTAPNLPSPSARVTAVGYMIFASRWLQAPLYFGLIVAQVVYVWQFLKELWHLIVGGFTGEHVVEDTETHEMVAHVFGAEEIMLAVLGLVDVVMISNLLIMVIVGGYETFVSRIRLEGHPDQPEWLSHVNANVLKTKLAMSIVGISSIHLLRTFIESSSGRISNDVMLWQVVIHLAFVVSALALAAIDRMSLTAHQRAANAAAAGEGPADPHP